ncbi:MAG: hypothetical protein FJ336_08520, partial [Sphingomonadales bacterium]|nr:hypothetical protein [Sphingomonadales bacterium]
MALVGAGSLNPPLITTQPVNQTVSVGGNASFSVTATGTALLSYQWSKDGIVLLGATNATLTLTNVQPPMIGDYRVVVSNGAGSVTSSVATLNLQGVDARIWQGLVAYYPFDGNANDESGNGYTGTVSSAVLTTDRFNRTDRAYAFDGINSVITVAHNTIFNFNNNSDFSISVWAVLNSPTNNVPQFYLVSKGNGGGPQAKWIFGSGGSHHYQTYRNLYFHFNNPLSVGHWQCDGVPYSPQSNVWHHYMITKNGYDYRIYVNGSLFNAETASSQIPSGITAPLTIGRAENLSVNGKLDDIRIYNRALSANEVASLYASEAPVPPAITAQPVSQTVS